MSLTTGDRLLFGRYSLTERLATDAESQTWLAQDAKLYEEYLIRLWPFSGEQPDPYQRALWDYQLRLLYRLCSSPHAERSLVLLRDTGVDPDIMAFVMVLRADGYDSLEAALRERNRHRWLKTADEATRQVLWKALERLAAGLNLLHTQRVLHRNLTADAVYLDTAIGPPSLRLGGFEWSIRLGDPFKVAIPASWAPPPEFLHDNPRFSPETDWFAFGVLAVRLLLDLSGLATLQRELRHNAILNAIQKAPPGELTQRERLLLLSLLDANPTRRVLGEDVAVAIHEIAEILGGTFEVPSEGRPLILTVRFGNERGRRLVDRATEGGYLPDSADPTVSFSELNMLHRTTLKDFIRRDMQEAAVYAVPGAEYFILEGRELCLQITKFRVAASDSYTWNAAMCHGPFDIRGAHGSAHNIRELPPNLITVLESRETHEHLRSGRGVRSWETFLPQGRDEPALPQSLADFQDFLRCTHQLELLLRSEEIYRYELVGDPEVTGAVVRLRIRQAGTSDLIPSFFQRKPQLFPSIQREVAAGRSGSRLLYFSSEDPRQVFRSRPGDGELWEIEAFDLEEQTIVVFRDASTTLPLPPQTGLVRTFGFGGQMALINRRDAAIERLSDHLYLLGALTSPGRQFLDVGTLSKLPIDVPQTEMDKSKQAVLRDILRTRPIYVLQGPPGTGKTTLVKYLLRQIFHEDPEAQVLITAQAHGAVDVLRNRVNVLFEGAGEQWTPLSIRLGGREDVDEGVPEGSVPWVARRVLERTRDRLRAIQSVDGICTEWLATVEGLLRDLASEQEHGPVADFFELVKRSANITYCTMSARELEILAEGRQSYDWSIVEEGGKAHGFDLALPLQAGHRWLLIGDHLQLEAYGHKEFDSAVSEVGRLDQAVAALERLPDPGILRDWEWIKAWRDLDGDGKRRFQGIVGDRLRTFKYLWYLCARITGEEAVTEEESIGALAGRLTRQHRMHPRIAEIISEGFYAQGLRSETEQNGVPVAKVLHHIQSPEFVRNRPVLWLDLPWATVDIRYAEVAHGAGTLPYSNSEEIAAMRRFLMSLEFEPDMSERLELAVLSPYNAQVRAINASLADLTLPRGLVLKKTLAARREEQTRLAYTVDGFQGNEADIVLVSLVRNNTAEPGTGLGFLDSPARANVLLSRAERLLVIVGSWTFFENQVSQIALDNVTHDLWPWRKVLDVIQRGFDAGWAARVPGNSG